MFGWVSTQFDIGLAGLTEMLSQCLAFTHPGRAFVLGCARWAFSPETTQA
jgi:hypothetical protein